MATALGIIICEDGCMILKYIKALQLSEKMIIAFFTLLYICEVLYILTMPK